MLNSDEWRGNPGRTPSTLLVAVLTLAVALGLLWAGADRQIGSALPGHAPPSDAGAIALHAGLPLYFEANEGQVDARVELLSRGNAHSLFLTRDEAVLSTSDSLVRMQFVGANREPRISGVDPLQGTTHYLIGNDRANWRKHVPHYARARYESLYPGIDLVFYGNEGRLEYDFVVGPGADPGVIHVAFEGAEDLALDESGNLVLTSATTGGSELTFLAPVIYQRIDGVRQAVAGEYRLLGRSEVGFRVGAYDRSEVLVIDPILVFSTYIGGEDYEHSTGVAVDDAGNAYIVGSTQSVSYPLVSVSSARARASIDVFVSKLNIDSATLVYTLFIGTGDDDRGHDVAVDSSGHAYIVGATDSDIFPTVDPVQPTREGDADGFIAKLSRDGSALIYSTYLGGSSLDSAISVEVDALDSAYVSGFSESADFPTENALQPSLYGPSDVFIAKLTPAGSALTYSTYLGGSDRELGNGLDVDAAGSVYVTGGTYSTDFPTANPFSSTLTNGVGDVDVFVTKLNAAGTTLVYSTYIGGSGSDGGRDVAVDRAGNAYVVGKTSSSDFPTTPGAPQDRSGGDSDISVTKLISSGSSLVFSTYLGGGAAEEGMAIAVDRYGTAFVTGSTRSSNFPTLKPLQATLAGAESAFVTAFDSRGRGVYSTYLGGDQEDEALAIALDRHGDVYLTGNTNSSTFPTVRPYDGAANGLWDVFLSKLVMPLDFWVASSGTRDTTSAVAFPAVGEGPSRYR